MLNEDAKICCVLLLCCVYTRPQVIIIMPLHNGYSLKDNTVFGGGIDLKFIFSQSAFSNIDSDIKIHEKNRLWVVSHEFSLFMGTIAQCY